MRGLLIFLLVFTLAPVGSIKAQVSDPFDSSQQPWPEGAESQESDATDASKSEEDLLAEALNLQAEDKMLDYRSKLLTLVRRFPNNLTGHILLAEYYLKGIGNFRLSMRYVLKAESLFKQQNGEPPYPNNFYAQTIHSALLGLISDIKLNLDNYPGALEELETMEKYGYYESQFSSSKAWVLMKLNRIPEAIAAARAGLLLEAAPGHNLNVLGILLSLNNQREESISTFQQAIDYELSLGLSGNASTPLNNVGEVLRETFREEQAIRSWEQALRLPDGCDHILPSLNLAVVYLESMNLSEAKEALDNFESCFAQFPLRNEEEHKAIIHLARGRIAWLAGDIDAAIENLNIALNRQQWFGKIGTSQEDLEAGIRTSLALALYSKNRQLALNHSWSIKDKLLSYCARISNSINARWQLRKARLILFGKLSNFEDLYARHSDSMLDYSWLGIILKDLNSNFVRNLLSATQSGDNRPRAKYYYQLFLAENLLAHGSKEQARTLLSEIIEFARIPYDLAIKANAMALLALSYSQNSHEYQELALKLFEINPAILRLRGIKLPVQAIELTPRQKDLLSEYNFIWSASSPWGIKSESSNGKSQLGLYTLKEKALVKRAEADSEQELYTKFLDTVFMNFGF